MTPSQGSWNSSQHLSREAQRRWIGGLDAALIKTALQIWFQTVKWNVPTARGWSRACEGPGG